MYKLIIVDDECAIRNGLCSYFPWHDIGFEVVASFENGMQALEYIKKADIHAVLTDIRMPIMDGIELTRCIAEVKPSIKIVYLSGHRDFEYAKSALDYGVRSYILKPTKYENIFDTFTKLRLELDREYTLFPEKNDKAAIPVKLNVIESVKDYISNHVGDVTLENAAAHSRLNPYYLSSLFRQQTGEKFSDYVLKVKMDTAAKLLSETDNKIYEISLAVGYTSANSFSRTFKNYYNISPKDYRRAQDI